eukprot:GEMP01016123.1.p1 GENE.GEMP01016123.1~~GEMP01016123.1.p1  ORF type:complete len:345 (+),score=87.12 GEMP01016123.1:989-2023(+)
MMWTEGASTWDVSQKTPWEDGAGEERVRPQSVAELARPHLALLKKKMKHRTGQTTTTAGFRSQPFPSMDQRMAHTFDPSMGDIGSDTLQRNPPLDRRKGMEDNHHIEKKVAVPSAPAAPGRGAAEIDDFIDAEMEAKMIAQGGFPAETIDDGELQPCGSCGRSFNAKALERHIKICKKVFQQKRNAFDAAERRLDHFDSSERPKPAPKKSGAPQVKKKGGNWREKSEAFRAAICNARASEDHGDPSAPSSGQGAEQRKRLEDAERRLAAARDESGDVLQCPHCKRKFNADAAARHIPICQKTFGKKGMLIKGGGQLAAAKTKQEPPPSAPRTGFRKATRGGANP